MADQWTYAGLAAEVSRLTAALAAADERARKAEVDAERWERGMEEAMERERGELMELDWTERQLDESLERGDGFIAERDAERACRMKWEADCKRAGRVIAMLYLALRRTGWESTGPTEREAEKAAEDWLSGDRAAEDVFREMLAQPPRPEGA